MKKLSSTLKFAGVVLMALIIACFIVGILSGAIHAPWRSCLFCG
jgi:hypothetical protein